MFISKLGDGYSTTYSTDIYYTSDGEIIIGLNNQYTQEVEYCPFDVLLRILGVTTDKEIIENILINISDKDIEMYIK